MKLNQKYLALLNCSSKDKRPQDLDDMKSWDQKCKNYLKFIKSFQT